MMTFLLKLLPVLLIYYVQDCTAVCGKGYSWKCPKPIIMTVGQLVGLILGVFAAAGLFLGVVIYCGCVGRRLPKCCKRQRSYSDREVRLTYPPYGMSPHQAAERLHQPA